jgi:hypothetical protein
VDEGTVWFAVSGIAPELAGAAAHVLMDYEHAGPQWRRGYPADAPQLERAWQGFARHMEAMLRQAARLDPVPWRDALQEVCQRTSGQPVDGGSPVARHSPCAVSWSSLATWTWSAMRRARPYWETCSATR